MPHPDGTWKLRKIPRTTPNKETLDGKHDTEAGRRIVSQETVVKDRGWVSMTKLKCVVSEEFETSQSLSLT